MGSRFEEMRVSGRWAGGGQCAFPMPKKGIEEVVCGKGSVEEVSGRNTPLQTPLILQF